MIKVHHLENSRSQRVLWLLEELGMDYEVVRYARDPKTMLAPPELARIHPLGKSPVIEDDGLVIAETGAIVEYLVERGGGRLGPPANREAILRYRHFLHYAEGSMMPPLLAAPLVVNRLGCWASPPEAAAAMFGKHLDWLEKRALHPALVRRRGIQRRRHHDEFPLEAARHARAGRRGQTWSTGWSGSTPVRLCRCAEARGP